MMKYTKAEVEVIVLDNVDIVTTSLAPDATEQEKLDYLHEIVCKGNNNGHYSACKTIGSAQYKQYYT